LQERLPVVGWRKPERVQFSHPLDQFPLPSIEKLMVQDERVEVPSYLECKTCEERVGCVCVQAAVGDEEERSVATRVV